MPNNKFNIEITQGSTFERYITVKHSNGSFRDLSQATCQMQIRPSYSSDVVTESLSTSNGEITINVESSVISLILSAERTANIYVDLNDTSNPPKTKYVYDFELDDDGKVEKLLWGDVFVFGEVTR